MKILVVDDSSLARSLLIDAMNQAELGEHVFREAGNGIEALEQVHSEPPDLILSDLRMPRMDGIELLEELQRLGVSVPFCLVTGGMSSDAEERAVALGVAKIVAKPFSPQTLADALRDLFE